MALSVPANAATFGEDSWMELAEGAKEFGISDEMVDELLYAGMLFSCKELGDDTVGLNAWFLHVDGDEVGPADTLYTNFHAFTGNEEVITRQPKNCSVALFADLAEDTAPRYVIDATTLEVPRVRKTYGDRGDIARMRTVESIPGSISLRVSQRPVLNRTEIFLVSEKPRERRTSPTDLGPIIQKCMITRQYQGNDYSATVFLSDCDTQPGISAGLILIRDKKQPGRLLPFGMHRGSADGEFEVYSDKTPAAELQFNKGFFWLKKAGPTP